MQETAFGAAELVALIKVRRAATGKFEYFRVEDGKNVAIDEATYYREGGQ